MNTMDESAVVAERDQSMAMDVHAVAISIANSRSEARHRGVAEAAYFLAQRRGFEPGHELEDWLAAEKERAAYGAGQP